MLGWKGIAYMEKIAVGPAGKGARLAGPVDRGEPATRWPRPRRCDVDDLTVVILERDRHDEIISRVREAGARVKLITDGDIAGGIMPSLRRAPASTCCSGIGGSPEAVTTACALKCLGGDIQCRYWPRNDKERQIAEEQNLPLGKILTIDDLVVGRRRLLLADRRHHRRAASRASATPRTVPHRDARDARQVRHGPAGPVRPQLRQADALLGAGLRRRRHYSGGGA